MLFYSQVTFIYIHVKIKIKLEYSKIFLNLILDDDEIKRKEF